MAKNLPLGSGGPVDGYDLFTDVELKALRDEAHKKALEEFRKGTREKILEAYLREERARLLPGDQIVSCTIALPPYAEYIRIDRDMFHDGETYRVSRRVMESLVDIMARAWAQENATHGKSILTMNREKNYYISGANFNPF